MGGGPDSPCNPIEFLEDPAGWGAAWVPDADVAALLARCRAVGLAHAAAARADPAYQKLLMTPSQTAVFESIVNRRWQVVWGPPGTGKTHFLALAILRLLAGVLAVPHSAAPRKKFRVLVCAETNKVRSPPVTDDRQLV